MSYLLPNFATVVRMYLNLLMCRMCFEGWTKVIIYMRVTLIQMDIAWGDIDANCRTADKQINAVPGSDLYVLPEMWSTGFATKPEDVADTDGRSLRWMQQKADEVHAAICGSVAVKVSDGSYRNRMYFVKPSSTGGTPIDEVEYYDKHHLFTYGGEHRRYKAGEERKIVEWQGVRFLLQVCYDLRFPVFSRNHGDYDCAIYVASWPTSRIEVWRVLLRARAIENQCYVLGVDRVGADPVCTYCGGTEIIDAYGRIVATVPDDVQGTISYDIDLPSLQAFRQKFPVLDDRD